VRQNVPSNFIPPAACDPLDADGLNKFFAAGVQLLGLCRIQWSNQNVPAPKIWWQLVSQINQTYQLTGAGAVLGQKTLTDRGMRP
jgi:hypothetical protein